MQSGKKSLRRWVSREDGVVAVEFVILFPLLVLIVVGIVEFGHLWYVRQTLTNASREGARAAVVYNVDPVTKLIIDAAARTKLATDAVDNYLQDPVTGRKFLTSWTRTVTFPDGGTNTGQRLTVTVTSPSGLLLLPKLLPAFDKINLASETTMRLE